jgi:hypothetical protein
VQKLLKRPKDSRQSTKLDYIFFFFSAASLLFPGIDSGTAFGGAGVTAFCTLLNADKATLPPEISPSLPLWQRKTQGRMPT